MKRFDSVITAYSLLLLVGGAIGFFVAGSIMSLIMSGGFAALLVIALYWSRTNLAAGVRTIYLLLSVLVLFFGYRWFGGKFMPSGALFFVTLIVLFAATKLAPKNTNS